jgi:hypothetical protein
MQIAKKFLALWQQKPKSAQNSPFLSKASDIVTSMMIMASNIESDIVKSTVLTPKSPNLKL